MAAADERAKGEGHVGNFAHLHLHTQYSLLDGACKLPDLMTRAR
ncbi:MAG: PHP domain-containing protein, partial [Bacillota bacterium]